MTALLGDLGVRGAVVKSARGMFCQFVSVIFCLFVYSAEHSVIFRPFRRHAFPV